MAVHDLVAAFLLVALHADKVFVITIALWLGTVQSVSWFCTSYSRYFLSLIWIGLIDLIKGLLEGVEKVQVISEREHELHFAEVKCVILGSEVLDALFLNLKIFDFENKTAIESILGLLWVDLSHAVWLIRAKNILILFLVVAALQKSHRLRPVNLKFRWDCLTLWCVISGRFFAYEWIAHSCVYYIKQREGFNYL